VKDDLCFESGDQWPEDDSEETMKHIVKNDIRKFTNRLVNPVIQNAYAPDLGAEDEVLEPLEAPLTKEVAKYLTKDRAREAYETAYRSAVIAGYGAFKIDVKQTRRGKEPCITEIQDVTSVMVDPYIETVDGSDAEDAAILTWMDGKAAKRKYGEEATVAGEWSDSMYGGWSRPSLDSVPELVFYQKKYRTSRTSTPSEDGTIELTTDTEPYVEIYKFVGDLLVERSTLEIPYIPIVLVVGDMKYTRKGVCRSGIVDLARTSQKLINFYASGELDLSAVPPRPLWLMPYGADEGLESIWDQINTKRYSRVPYKAVDDDGATLPAPSYVQRMLDTSAYMNGRAKSEEDLESEIGITANSFGEEEHAGQSGRSVFLRQMKGEIATAHYQSNLEKSVKHAIRILIDILSATSECPVHIKNEEAGIDQETPLKEFDFSSEDFEVSLLAGPSNESRKQYGLAQLMEIGEKIGFQAFADLIVTEIPGIPNAEAVAERLYKMLPPELQDKEDEEGAPDPEAIKALEEARMALDESEQTTQMLWDYVQQLQGELISGAEDRASKETLERMKIQKELNIAQIRAEVDLYKAELSAAKDGTTAPPAAPDTQDQVDAASLAVDEIAMDRASTADMRTDQVIEGMTEPMEEPMEDTMVDPEAMGAAEETFYPVTEGPVTMDLPSTEDLGAADVEDIPME